MTQVVNGPFVGTSGIDVPTSTRHRNSTTSTTAKAQRQVPRWVMRYRMLLLAADVSALIVAGVASYLLRFGSEPTDRFVVYSAVGLIVVLGWLVALQANGGYELKHLATGPEEAKRVLRGSAITGGLIGAFCYAARVDLARGFVVLLIPTGVLLLAAGRTGVRCYVRNQRRAGRWTTRILAVGTSDSVRHLDVTMRRAVGAGLQIVGACAEDAERGTELAPGVPVIGGVFTAADAAVRVEADVVAVTGEGLGPVGVRELGWALEGTGRGMVMAPSLTEVAGTRLHVTPVEGLPLVWLERPQLGKLPRVVKRAMDVVGAISLLVLGFPILLATAVAIKVTSRGPVFFRQARLGLNGDAFSIIKFRSMCVGAEAQRELILEQNEQDGGGILFKIKADPRVTTVGKWIRKFSVDELPQLINVVTGSMSLVGPRPLAAADSHYEGSARRRLMVKPGLTGLWQISGRSDTSWDDAVRMDLYYVENWSMGLDLSILVRTAVCVLARKGAY